MEYSNWEDVEFLGDVDLLSEEKKVKNKSKKRKWREIESVKEKRRLKRQLEDFEQYSF